MSKYALKIVEIEINSQCNRKCKYCPNSISERKHKGDMNFSLFLTIMKQLKEIKFEGRISFHFYGEPFLSKNLNSFAGTAPMNGPKKGMTLVTPMMTDTSSALGNLKIRQPI